MWYLRMWLCIGKICVLPLNVEMLCFAVWGKKNSMLDETKEITYWFGNGGTWQMHS